MAGVLLLVSVPELLLLLVGDHLVAVGERYILGLRMLRWAIYCAVAASVLASGTILLVVEAARERESRRSVRVGALVVALLLGALAGHVWYVVAHFADTRILDGIESAPRIGASGGGP